MTIIDGGGPSGFPDISYPATDLGEILQLIGRQLFDITGTRWDADTVLVPYINLGIIEILNIRPEAYPVSETISLVAGAIQTLGASDIALLSPICNLSGSTRGAAVTLVEKAQLDSVFPDWMTSFPLGAASKVVRHVIRDPHNPKRFYVFPPQPTGTDQKLETIVSQIPAALTDSDGTFPLDDSYKPAIIDYVIFRCLAEETTIPNALAKAKDFEQRFYQHLGIKNTVEKGSEKKAKKT